MAGKTKKVGEVKRSWYSKGLTEKGALKLGKRYARMYDVGYGLIGDDVLALSFMLMYEDGNERGSCLTNPRDIKQLFWQTGTTKASELENTIVETYNVGEDGRGRLMGISINPHLVAQRSNSDSD